MKCTKTLGCAYGTNVWVIACVFAAERQEHEDLFKLHSQSLCCVSYFIGSSSVGAIGRCHVLVEPLLLCRPPRLSLR